MFEGKPIIGIVGGIGSGKSFVARLFGELGCVVIDSDAQARAALDDPEVRQILRQWWGESAVPTSGPVDRNVIAKIVFNNEPERKRLEGLIHPWVSLARDRQMREAVESAKSGNRDFPAFVWDTPLLFEVGLNAQCDAIVFVEADLAVRQARVRESRGWDGSELARRENLQLALDKKRSLADHIVRNTTEAAQVRIHVCDVLSRILEKLKPV